jgi:hypothetical protein
MMAGLSPEVREQVAAAVTSGIHPIFVIAAGLAFVGFLLSLVLKEIPLHDRKTS